MSDDTLLKAFLETSVPLYAQEIITQGEVPWEDGHEISNLLGEKGDQVLFKGKETAKIANELARGIAILSFVPGGINTFGLHFENRLDNHNEEMETRSR